MDVPPPQKSAPSVLQRRLSLILLGVLVFIAGTVLWLQSRYDPSLWRERPRLESRQPGENPEFMKGLIPISPVEIYKTETLSDKINGKADLYLTAGFQSLESRRFGLASDESRWMERYVYDMGALRNAFSVYSAQRRPESEPVNLTPYAYMSANGLFMVHGPYYVELIAADTSHLMQTRMKDLASAFVRSRSVPPDTLHELSLFGAQGNVPHSTELIADSAFGIQDFNWVYTSNYADKKAQATAFVSNRGSARNARSSAEAFIGYWKEFGGEAVQTHENPKEARVVFILDNYEMAMVHDRYVFGVHEATDLAFGLDLVAQLKQAIAEAGK